MVLGCLLATPGGMLQAQTTNSNPLDGDGAQTIGANGGTGELHDLRIEKPSGTVTLQDDIQLSGHLTHVSGDVDAVNGVHDAWNVARERDPQTGDVTHPPLVYIVDPSGQLAYAATGGVAMLAELLDRS